MMLSQFPLFFRIMILSDIQLSADYLVVLSERLENLSYIKLDFGNIIHNARLFGETIGNNLGGVF